MESQFVKVYNGIQNLYIEGSPIVIAASAITKDNAQQTLFAQFKFKNIDNKPISAIIISFDAKDIKNNIVQSIDEYQYLDLDVKKADFACGNIPIYLSNAFARSIVLKSIEVIFSDGNNWKSESDAWESIPVQRSLSDNFDSEEISVLEALYGSKAKFFPREYKDLALCICGEIHKIGTAECCICKNEFNNLLNKNQKDFADEINYFTGTSLMDSNDTASLEKAISYFSKCPDYTDSSEMIKSCQESINRIHFEEEETARIKEEERKLKHEKVELRKKKLIKILKIAVPAFVGLLAIILFLFLYLLPMTNYKKANLAIESKDYKTAYTLLEKYSSFKDSEALIIQTKELRAEELIKSKDYDEAYELYNQLGKTSVVNSDMRKRAEEYIKNEKYIEAYALYKKLGDNTSILNSKLSRAKALIKSSKYDEAEELLEDIKDNAKAKELIENLPIKRISNTLKNVKDGDVIKFGKFEQDNNISNGAEDIEWIVIKKTDKKIQVISKYALNFMRQFNEYATSTWSCCRIREWLNKDFYDDAFSDVEKKFIINSKVTKDSKSLYADDFGPETVDHLFLLSMNDVDTLLSYSERICFPTAYAVTKTSWYDSTYDPVCWWIRQPSFAAVDEYSNGFVEGGSYQKNSLYYYYEPDAVRPTMWISIDGNADDGSKYYYVNTEKDDLNVRAEKSTASKVIGHIPKNTLIKVIDYNYDWSKIKYNGKEGYVSSDYLKNAVNTNNYYSSIYG